MKWQKESQQLKQSTIIIDDQKPPDKQQALDGSEEFDDPKFQNESCRITLLKLIFVINQGIVFGDQEKELLFFRVTKLLVSQDPGLRRLVYKYLRILRAEKFIHIILQTIIKDLMNSNEFIKVEALRLVSIFQEEEYIFQIEILIKQVQLLLLKAAFDTNKYISSTAILVGINIFNKFPQMVSRGQPVIQYLFNQTQEINYHSLILLYEINKLDKINVDDILKFPKQPQFQVVNLQLLQFINEISIKSDQNERLNKEILHFLNYSFQNKLNLIFLEVYSIIIQNEDQLHIYSDKIHRQFTQIFIQDFNDIEIYRAIKILTYAIQTNRQSNISNLKFYIEVGTYYPNPSVAARSILSCFQLQENKLEVCLQQLFNSTNRLKYKVNFMEGLIELVELHPKYLKCVYDSIQLYIFKDSDTELIISAMKIICIALQSLKDVRLQVLRALFELSNGSVIEIQQNAFMMVSSVCFRLNIYSFENLSRDNIYFGFNYLKNQFQIKSDSFDNESSKEFSLIKEQLLKLIEANEQNINWSKLSRTQKYDQRTLIDTSKPNHSYCLTKQKID